MTPLLLTSSLVGGLWLVRRADKTYDSIRTCRYRELNKLQLQAANYSAGYLLFGLAPLALPGGAAVTAAVFAYAIYCRFR